MIHCGTYQHYKGGLYLVLGIAEHTETKEIEVVYVSMNANLPGPRMRVRPLAMFVDMIETGLPRFKYMGNGLGI